MKMFQLKESSVYMKILLIIPVEFINMFLVPTLEDMLLKSLEGDILQIVSNIGLLLTHGMKLGEKKDTSESWEVLMNVVLKVLLL